MDYHHRSWENCFEHFIISLQRKGKICELQRCKVKLSSSWGRFEDVPSKEGGYSKPHMQQSSQLCCVQGQSFWSAHTFEKHGDLTERRFTPTGMSCNYPSSLKIFWTMHITSSCKCNSIFRALPWMFQNTCSTSTSYPMLSLHPTALPSCCCWGWGHISAAPWLPTPQPQCWPQQPTVIPNPTPFGGPKLCLEPAGQGMTKRAKFLWFHSSLLWQTLFFFFRPKSFHDSL